MMKQLMIKKIFSKFLFLILFIAVLIPIGAASAKTNNVVHLYFFNGDGCPHCADEKVFLNEMANEYGRQLVIHSYEVWYNEDNAKLFETFAKAFDFEPSGIPVTFIGSQYWTGFGSNAETGIREAIKSGVENGVVDAVQIVNGEEAVIATIDSSAVSTIDLLLIGTIDLSGKSIWLSTVLIGIVDGFNPCSLWVLTMLLAMIVRTNSRKKTLIIGIVFLTVTAAIYALFIGCRAGRVRTRGRGFPLRLT